MNESQIKEKYPADQFLPVLISEVTRMSMGNYCVAGWDIHARRMVRPLQSSGANWKLMAFPLQSSDANGDAAADRTIFSVGHLVNCLPTGRKNSVYPHATEDLLLSGAPSFLERFDESGTYALLLPATFQSIQQLFGRALVDGKYVQNGTNCNSLGGVRAARRQIGFLEDSFGKLRLQLQDVDGVVYRLPVTCDWLQHLFSPSDEDAEPHFGVAEANEWLCVNPPDTDIILRIGLARGWSGKDRSWHPPRCYAQLNGIVCPQDNNHVFAGPPSS